MLEKKRAKIINRNIGDLSTFLWVYKTGNMVKSVSTSSDGSYIVAGSGDKKVYFIDRNGNLLWKYKLDGEGVGSVSISPEGSYIAAGSVGAHSRLYLIDRDGKQLWNKNIPNSKSVSVSSNGSHIAAIDLNGEVHFFNRDGKLLWSYNIHGGRLSTGVSVSSDGLYIAAGSSNNNVHFFNQKGKLLWSYKTDDSVDSVSVSSDGSYIAAGSGGILYFFNREGKLLWSYKTDGVVDSLSVSSDGSYIAFAGYILGFLDQTGKLLWTYKSSGQAVSFDCVSISPNGSYVTTGSSYKGVYFFKFEKEKQRYTEAVKAIHSAKEVLKSFAETEFVPKIVYAKIEQAQSALKVGNTDSAVKIARQAEKEAVRLKKDFGAKRETTNVISLIESEIAKFKSYGVQIPKSDELIELAEAELTKNNFERAKELASEAKRIASERKTRYDRAFRSFSEAERIFYEAKTEGVIISSDLETKAKQAFDDGNYGEAIKLAEALKDLVSNMERKYRESVERIKAAESGIESAKEFGCELLDAEERLKSAEQLFGKGAYEKVIKASEQIEELVKKVKEKTKPKITISHSQTSFKPNKWERIDITIKNSGTTTAKEIHVDYPKERVEIEGLMATEELKPNEEKKLQIAFRPVQVGEVPLTATITYKDLDNKEYKGEQSFWITVGDELQRKVEDHETPTEKKEMTVERAIYDSCKRDFIEGRLPRMKEWINRYDPGAYWFAVSLQNSSDNTIEEWGVELETSSALKIEEVKIEGMEIEIPHEAHLGAFKISVPKEYGIVIPKGGAQRVYFKLRADKPKTMYEISGVFKSKITGNVPIRPKEFKYLCDAGMPPEAVKSELKKTFSEKEAARLALSFKTVQELDRMCNHDAKTEEYSDKILTLKNYTEGFSANFTKQLDEFSRFMEQEQMGYLDEEYKGQVRRFCTNLVDVWISEFLKG